MSLWLAVADYFRVNKELEGHTVPCRYDITLNGSPYHSISDDNPRARRATGK